MATFQIDDTEIQIEPSERSGSQTIRIQATSLGKVLAQTLAPDIGEPQDDFYLLSHDANVDERVCELVDVLVSMRYSHPRLMQISFRLPGGE